MIVGIPGVDVETGGGAHGGGEEEFAVRDGPVAVGGDLREGVAVRGGEGGEEGGGGEGAADLEDYVGGGGEGGVPEDCVGGFAGGEEEGAAGEGAGDGGGVCEFVGGVGWEGWFDLRSGDGGGGVVAELVARADGWRRFEWDR